MPPTSVVVPLADESATTEPIEVSLGRDIEVTPEIEAELGGELGMDTAVVRDRLADLPTFSEYVQEDAPRQAVGTARSLRSDVLRAALRDEIQLPSSLIYGAQVWRVTDMAQMPSGGARVSLGRRDTHELELAMPSESAQTLQLGDAVMGADVLWRKKPVLGFGRVDLEFLPDPEQPPPIPIWIPLVRLHRPKRAGCRASYSIGREDTNDVEMAVSVLGSGGGGGVKTTFSVTQTYTATAACMETVIPAKLRLQVGRTMINGTEVAYGLRTEVVDVEPNRLETRTIPTHGHACQRPTSSLHNLPMRDYDYTKSPKSDSASDEIVVAREVRGKMSVGLEGGGSLPIKLSLDYQRTTSHQIGITTVFAPGARYVAYAPTPAEGSSSLEQAIEICWTTMR